MTSEFLASRSAPLTERFLEELPHEVPIVDAPEDVVLWCAVILSRTPGWQRRPRQALDELILGLNGIFAWHPQYRYNHGFPQPAAAIRELAGLRGLCNAAKKTGRSDLLLFRMKVLARDGRDSLRLLEHRVAATIDPARPQDVPDEHVRDRMVEIAQSAPGALMAMAEPAAALLRPLVRSGGRGGNRNRGALFERDLIFELGVIFREVAGRAPATTYVDRTRTYTGDFVLFVQAVFEALGLSISGRMVARHLKTLAIPEWRPQKRWPRSGSPSPTPQ